MSSSTVLLTITTITASVLAMYLGWSLHLERARREARDDAVEQMPTSVVPSGNRSDETQDSNPPLDQRSAAALAAAAAARRSSEPTPSAVPASQLRAPSRLRSRASETADLAYRRLELQQKYSDAATVLSLQPDEVDRFFDLLARQERRDAEADAGSEGSNEATERELRRRWDTNKAEQAALLGEARMADWMNYVNSLGARAEVRELRMQLADSDYPLRRDQYEPLVAALAKEQVRHNSEREELRRSSGHGNNLAPQQRIDYMDRRMDLIEQSLERRRSAAAAILDTEQLKRYRSMLDLQHLRSQVEYDSFVTDAQAEKAAGR